MEIIAASTAGAEASLTLADFQFPLPAELIAQTPADERDGARLMVLDRRNGTVIHSRVHALPEHLRSGDLLVVNDTHVIPARVFGRTESGAAVEILLIRPTPTTPIAGVSANSTLAHWQPTPGNEFPGSVDSSRLKSTVNKAMESPSGDFSTIQLGNSLPGNHPVGGSKGYSDEGRHTIEWLCLGKPARRLRVGARLAFGGNVRATVASAGGNGRYRLVFDGQTDVLAWLAEHGELPLPPYIRRPDGPLPLDRTRYQTIFATTPGAIAAPTAGLHFTAALMDALQARGIEVARLTLHVGPGTFVPVRCNDVRRHVMEAEWYEIPPATAAAIERVKAHGGRVVAAGTTTTRALESAASGGGAVRAGANWAELFIVPGHHFRVVDALFTNFHLPGSTLLLLVSAFAGRGRVLDAYGEATRQRYRFYSYGDAMLIQ